MWRTMWEFDFFGDTIYVVSLVPKYNTIESFRELVDSKNMFVKNEYSIPFKIEYDMYDNNVYNVNFVEIYSEKFIMKNNIFCDSLTFFFNERYERNKQLKQI